MPYNSQRLLGPGSRYSPEDEEILNSFDESGYGLRPNGTPKGQGWLGPLPMNDGSDKVATEISIDVDGEDIPLIVPTLTQDELDYILSGNRPTREMVDKAAAFAEERRRQGFSVYADPIAQKLGPGSRNWKDETRSRDRFNYGGDPRKNITKYKKAPIETEIRNFVPDPEQIGDFDFEIGPEDFQNMLNAKERWRRSVHL